MAKILFRGRDHALNQKIALDPYGNEAVQFHYATKNYTCGSCGAEIEHGRLYYRKSVRTGKKLVPEHIDFEVGGKGRMCSTGDEIEVISDR